MRYLIVNEVLETYFRVMAQSGGAVGLRDLGALESAVAQPRVTFGGEELYSTLAEKAAALGYSLIQNHPFIDGNKRIGHAAMELFLLLNGQEIAATVEEQVTVILHVAAGKMGRREFTDWLKQHVVPKNQ
jgi:death on curing protein